MKATVVNNDRNADSNIGNSATVIDASDLAKEYRQGENCLVIFEGLDFTIRKGERIAIVGASGSGKSTLLSLLGGLDKPTTGRLAIGGQDIAIINDDALSQLRNRYLGFVYQFHHLLPEFSALENVMMPLLIAGTKKSDAKQHSLVLLEKVGLVARAKHKPSELSGGERQRVAIARALVNNPHCVLMDEPTGNLDEKASTAVENLIQDISSKMETAFIVVTHDLKVAKTMDQILTLENGKLSAQQP